MKLYSTDLSTADQVIHIGRKKICIYPELLGVEVSVEEDKSLEQTVARLVELSGLPSIPNLVRVDGTILPNGEYRIFEVNSIAPAGLGYCFEALSLIPSLPQAAAEAEKLLEEVIRALYSEVDGFLICPDFYPVFSHENRIYRSVTGREIRDFLLLDEDLSPLEGLSSAYRQFRTFPAELEDTGIQFKNSLDSGKVGDKGLLVHLPHTVVGNCSIVTSNHPMKHSGFWFKPLNGFGGKGVVPPGSTAPSSKQFLVQEAFPLTKIGDRNERFGVDFFLLDGRVIASMIRGTTSPEATTKLNLSAGSSFFAPSFVNIV